MASEVVEECVDVTSQWAERRYLTSRSALISTAAILLTC